MAKTRDLAKARLDQLKSYLNNVDDMLGKTGPQVANEILIHIHKFRKPGQQRKYGSRKTRDLAEATINQVIRYLENPNNVNGKTGFELQATFYFAIFSWKNSANVAKGANGSAAAESFSNW